MKVKYIRSFFEFDWINDEYKLINDLNNLLPSDQYGTLPHKVYDKIFKIKKNPYSRWQDPCNFSTKMNS